MLCCCVSGPGGTTAVARSCRATSVRSSTASMMAASVASLVQESITLLPDHNYISHNYIDHNYIGHKYIDHNYKGLARTLLYRTGARSAPSVNAVATVRCRAMGCGWRWGLGYGWVMDGEGHRWLGGSSESDVATDERSAMARALLAGG